MIYTAWDYLLPTLGLSVFVFVSHLLLCLVTFISQKKKWECASTLVYGPYLTGLLFFASMIYALPISFAHTYATVDPNENREIAGYVQDIHKDKLLPIYFDRQTKSFCRASILTIGDEEYYILNDHGISEGDYLAIVYTNQGHCITEWAKVSTDYVPRTFEIVPFDPFKNNAQINGPWLSKSNIFVIYGGCILFLLLFQKRITQKRQDYIRSNEIITPGIVDARPISIYTCPIETVLFLFLALSILIRYMQLTLFLGAVLLIFGFIKWQIQQTCVVYDEDEFTYVTSSGKQTFNRSQILSAEFQPCRRQGFNQLVISFPQGGRIHLEQEHYTGLTEFEQWLNEGRK